MMNNNSNTLRSKCNCSLLVLLVMFSLVNDTLIFINVVHTYIYISVCVYVYSVIFMIIMWKIFSLDIDHLCFCVCSILSITSM